MTCHFISATERDDADGAVGEIPQQGSVRFLQVEDYGEIVRCVDAIDEAVNGGFGAANLALQQGIERPLDVARSESASVMELHAVMEMKNVGEGIGNLPAFGQAGGDIQIIAAGKEVVENQIVDALRLPVEADSRIKVGGARFDQHHERVGIGFAGAGDLGERECERGENE